MSVGRNRAQRRRAIAFRRVQIDSVEIITGFLGGNGEPGPVVQIAQIAGGNGKAVRQIAAGHDREILARKSGQFEHGAARPERELSLVGTGADLDLRAFGQLADDVEQCMRGDRDRPFLRDLGGSLFDHGDIHVGRG